MNDEYCISTWLSAQHRIRYKTILKNWYFLYSSVEYNIISYALSLTWCNWKMKKKIHKYVVHVEYITTINFYGVWLTLFPSRSKWVKFSVILNWTGAIISHMQLLFPGYRSGNEGLVIVPLVASIIPPQASENILCIIRKQNTLYFYYYVCYIFFVHITCKL